MEKATPAPAGMTWLISFYSFSRLYSAVNANIANITPDDTVVGGNPWTSKHIVDMLCPPLEVSGNPVQCYPVPGYPLGITASWEPTQEGEGDPSPDNIRPIKGKSNINIIAAKHNLLREIKPITNDKDCATKILTETETLALARALQNRSVCVSFKLETNNVTFKEDSVSGPKRIGVEAPIKTANGKILYAFPAWIAKTDIKSSSTVIVSNTVNLGNFSELISGSLTFYIQGLVSGTVKASEFAIYLDSDSTKNFDGIYARIATLTLPETIYGGSVDAVTGEGMKQWNIINLNDSIHVFKEQGYYVLDIPTLGGASGEKPDASLACCSHYPPSTKAVNGYGFYMRYGGNGFVIFDSRFSTSEELQAYLAEQYAAGTPVQITYKLATPTAFSATGNTSVPALSGINTVLTDVDSLEVTGREDLIHAISATQSIE